MAICDTIFGVASPYIPNSLVDHCPVGFVYGMAVAGFLRTLEFSSHDRKGGIFAGRHCGASVEFSLLFWIGSSGECSAGGLWPQVTGDVPDKGWIHSLVPVIFPVNDRLLV